MSTDAPATAPGTLRPGGRTARNRAAIFAATMTELATNGFANLSLDAVAARAGVHKTTIYRRWRTRAELVAAAFMDAAEQNLEVVDTGHIDRDARRLARSVATTLVQPTVAAAVRATLSLEAPELRTQITSKFWSSRRASVGPLIERAIARGQLPPDVEPAAVVEAIAAPLYFRLLLSGEPLTNAAAESAADAALAAARAGAFDARRKRKRSVRREIAS